MDFKERKLNLTDDECKELVTKFFIAIGEDPNRIGLQDTPQRVVNMWKEIYRGYDKNLLPKVTTFPNGEDGMNYDEMVTDEGNFYSQCEHHNLSFHGSYFLAYTPHPKGKILGLSKVARVVDYFSAKLQIQERLVSEIVEYIYCELSKDTKYPPIGIALLMRGKHLCKCSRGVKKDGWMKSVCLKGAFKNDVKARNEFYSLMPNSMR
jgi:GTP cyclohydrolase I